VRYDALWRVGDQGVYLMANTSDGPRQMACKEDNKTFVVHAAECDLTTLPFDQWWDAKRATFGGDDGVEFIALAEVERLIAKPSRGSVPDALRITISPRQFMIEIVWRRGLNAP